MELLVLKPNRFEFTVVPHVDWLPTRGRKPDQNWYELDQGGEV